MQGSGIIAMVRRALGATPEVIGAVATLAGTYNEGCFSAYAPLGAVKSFVDAKLPGVVVLREVALVACLETKYFSVYFKRKVGVSFTDWLHAVRLQRALSQFDDWDLTITRIALDAGYPELRTFERAFKRTLGTTPASFRGLLRPESRCLPGMSR